MRKVTKKILCLSLAVGLGMTGLTACGGGSSEQVSFWIKGTETQLQLYEALKDEFNKTYGAENGVTVKTVQKPNGSYNNNVLVTIGSSSGPDVFLTEDALIKSWVEGHYMSDIKQDYDAITDIDVSDVNELIFKRLHYDKRTNSSNPDDPLYGVPLDIQPTALYYNRTLLENSGVIVISVDADDLDDWNQGLVPDRNDVYKNEISALNGVTVPKKGFYRSKSPYYYAGERTKAWVKPSSDEILVFNDRIAMNWDEVEDIGMYFTAEYNPKQGQPEKSQFGTTYGYFTEWWFNYGWSVGGDCLNDLTGKGEFNFSLLDPNPNYMVVGDSFTGRTGKVYKTGETISFLDKMNIAEGEILVPDDYGDYLKADGSGKAGIWNGITTEIAKGDQSAVAQIPSTKEAFLRYLKLGSSTKSDIDGEKGLGVSPNPSIVNSRGLTSYFVSGELAFAAQMSTYAPEWINRAKAYKIKIDVCPLVVYKQYEDPSDPDCDTVKVQGKVAGHSNAYSAVVRDGTPKKEQATKFLKWCASAEADDVRAKLGFYTMRESKADTIKFATSGSMRNSSIFSIGLGYQTPGDWWYMKDSVWVERWCVDLNASLRNGTMTYAEWLEGSSPASVTGGKVVVRTNKYLKNNYKYSEK